MPRKISRILDSRLCPGCGELFHPVNRNQSWCSTNCAQRYRRANSGKIYLDKRSKVHNLSRYYRRVYGIDVDELERMKEAQSNKCAICGCVSDRLCIDHDHKTNIIRELLCVRCNTALGSLNEDVEILQKMVDYIKKWRPPLAS